MSKYKLLIILLAIVFLGAGCGKKEESAFTPKEQAPIPNPISVTEPETSMATTTPENVQEKTIVTLQTSKGNIKLELFPQDAPKTVANFVKLAESSFYDGTTFHRIIPDFMIQGGDPLSKDDNPLNDGTGGPGYMFEDEINSRKIVRGTLAMANAGPDTNGSQFFIVTADAAPWLDGKHTVFGQVTDGMDVVEAIVKADRDGNDRPIKNIVISKITVAKGSL